MLCLFKAPSSYTGEDMAELYCHGNDFIVAQLLDNILHYCREAKPGEFTYRAFINGKIDLTQSEAIENLLSAQTINSQKVALMQLEGKLSNRITCIINKITDIRIMFELAIDFSEDEVPQFNLESIKIRIINILDEMKKMIASANNGIIIQEGLKVCIVGFPNVGKSSLFNSLLESDRAIITATPGTTRDYLEEQLILEGHLINLIDTAGIQDTTDIAEQLGIIKTQGIIEKADIILCVTSNEIDSDKFNEFLKKLPLDKVIKVINKVDLISNDKLSLWKKEKYIPCSTVLAGGLHELKRVLCDIFNYTEDEQESGIITNSRQLVCIKKAHSHLMNALIAINNNLGVDFVTFDILQSSNALEEVTGKISNDDILNTIFSKFCIGK
jgi:tRNA modification GTPase